ncbi:MAG: HNH endonuclease, partial [Candidatus Limnocylindrus sp.]
MPKRTSDPTYLANRRAILTGSPLCHWCGNNPATEADHLIEHDRGGTDDITNLVPACKQCNGRRGQHYRAKRDALIKAKREQAVNASANAIFRDNTLPPTPSFSVFVSDQPELAGIGSNQPGLAGMGREQPRLESARFGDDSFGPLVEAWAATHLMPLMPWQAYAVAGMLEHDGGKLHRREALVCTARQQGKSVLLTSLIGFYLTTYAQMVGRPQQVLSTANQLDRAEAIFSALAPVLVERFGAKQIQQIGRKKVTMPDGSTWEIRAASARLHGGSYDLIVVDELWNIAPTVMDDALRPSMIARPNPLLACFSTAGDMSSHSMIHMREQALADIDAGNQTDTYFAEWSMPMGADPKDEQWWGWANPALGTTVTIEALRAAAKKESFLRAH